MFYGYVTLSAICNHDGEKANAVNLGYGLFLVRIEIFGIYIWRVPLRISAFCHKKPLRISAFFLFFSFGNWDFRATFAPN